MNRSTPKYPTLGDFMAAKARGELSPETVIVEWTSSGRVEAYSLMGDKAGDDIDDDRECEVLYRSNSLETFLCEFGEAIGIETRIS